MSKKPLTCHYSLRAPANRNSGILKQNLSYFVNMKLKYSIRLPFKKKIVLYEYSDCSDGGSTYYLLERKKIKRPIFDYFEKTDEKQNFYRFTSRYHYIECVCMYTHITDRRIGWSLQAVCRRYTTNHWTVQI